MKTNAQRQREYRERKAKEKAEAPAKAEPAAPVVSAVPVRVEGTKVQRLPNGQFPKRVPICPPATVEQYATCKAMMSRGDTFRSITEATGATWAAINERALADDPKQWAEIQRLWRIAQAGRVISKAVDVASQQCPASTKTSTGPMGTTTTEEHKTDAGLVNAALAGLLPEVHGRGAGRAAPQINVSGNAAIFGGPPTPCSLDDFAADLLAPPALGDA